MGFVNMFIDKMMLEDAVTFMETMQLEGSWKATI
jgi:hypothetical protein